MNENEVYWPRWKAMRVGLGIVWLAIWNPWVRIKVTRDE